MALIAPSKRVRRTPFSPGVEAAGVSAYTVYNRTLLPAYFQSLEADYAHLKRHVQIWDVACERQIELCGPDARALLQLLTPRDLGNMRTDRCFYVPMVDASGGMLNDPVVLSIGPDRFWVSIADSDLMLWIKGIATALHMNVSVHEANAAPLAVQGPRANALMARLFGEAVTTLPFFGLGQVRFEGQDLWVARSGFSKQGGFEIYVEGDRVAMPLWGALMAAGADLEVRAGCPNTIERVESGLLSYGNDMTMADTPFHCGLGRFVNMAGLDRCLGGDALRKELQADPTRMIRPLAIQGHMPTCDRAWPVVTETGDPVGQVTSAAWSPDFKETVAIAMLDRAVWAPDTRLRVQTQDGSAEGSVRDTFWN